MFRNVVGDGTELSGAWWLKSSVSADIGREIISIFEVSMSHIVRSMYLCFAGDRL